jgi:hypothetical protein
MKIFVSYSRRDAGDFAEQIQSHFASFGHYEVFTDVNSIKAGDMWSDTIEDNISSCDIFVMIVTNGALQSPHVETEILQAQRDKKRIIPCFHRSVRNNDIKWGLNKIQGVEFEDKFELARNLYSKITSQNGKKPLEPTPKPVPPALPRHARKFKSLAIIVTIGVAAAVVGLLFALSIVNQPPVNQPPTANAGADQTVNSGETVILNGTASRDTSGSIYNDSLWEQIGGPSVNINDNSSLLTTFIAPKVSNDAKLVFTLRVGDDAGLISSPDGVVVIVKPIGGTPSGSISGNMTGRNQSGGLLDELREGIANMTGGQ